MVRYIMTSKGKSLKSTKLLFFEIVFPKVHFSIIHRKLRYIKMIMRTNFCFLQNLWLIKDEKRNVEIKCIQLIYFKKFFFQ